MDADCFIFHDIDLVPESPDCFYKKQFYDINGYSNRFWAWGAEDDDLSNRIRGFYKLKKVPRPRNSTLYHIYQLEHKREKMNPERRNILKNWKERWHHDGINVSRLFMFKT